MARVLIGNVKGPKGDAATVAVGTVTTGAAGSDASVTNSGTSSAAEFNFTIPKGAKGDAGTPGVTDYATASAAGLVRIGSDFNIDSNNGTISENNVFTQASSLAEINSGDSHATILGKIKKFMNTLMPSNFLVNSISSTATDKALTANMGKTIADNIETVTGDIATVETSATASRAYSVGEYLVLNGQLYIVTSAIANGGTITVGTNVSATTAGAQLKSLNDSLNGAIAPTKYTATAGSSVTINGQNIYKISRIVLLNFDVTTSETLATNSNILTNVPGAIATTELFAANASTGETHTLYVTSGGAVRTSGSLSAGTWIVNAAYVSYSN